jgi:hypothetical protein
MREQETADSRIQFKAEGENRIYTMQISVLLYPLVHSSHTTMTTHKRGIDGMEFRFCNICTITALFNFLRFFMVCMGFLQDQNVLLALLTLNLEWELDSGSDLTKSQFEFHFEQCKQAKVVSTLYSEELK